LSVVRRLCKVISTRRSLLLSAPGCGLESNVISSPRSPHTKKSSKCSLTLGSLQPLGYLPPNVACNWNMQSNASKPQSSVPANTHIKVELFLYKNAPGGPVRFGSMLSYAMLAPLFWLYENTLSLNGVL